MRRLKDKLIGKALEIRGKITRNKTDELRGRARQTLGTPKQTGRNLSRLFKSR